MISNRELYTRIATACKLAGITVSQLEKDLGFARGYLGKIKTGSNPSWRAVERVADRLNISRDYLFGKADNPHYAVTPDLHEKLVELSYSVKQLESSINTIISLTEVAENGDSD